MEIKWLPLRLNIIPLIDKQTQQVLIIFQQVRNDILQGDILAVQRLEELKETIRQRLKAVDEFYRSKAMDPRTRYLFASRTLLSKMVDSHHKFEQFAQDDPAPITPKQAQKSSRSRNSISPNSSTRRTPTKAAFAKQSQPSSFKNVNNSFFDKKVQKNEEHPGQLRLSDIQKSTKRKSPMKMVKEEYVGKKGSARKIEQGQTTKAVAAKKSQEVNELQRQKAEQSANLQKNGQGIKKSFKDLSQLVFTIKMTKEQYNSFMMLKRKNNHA